jgi:hypothetical protein
MIIINTISTRKKEGKERKKREGEGNNMNTLYLILSY